MIWEFLPEVVFALIVVVALPVRAWRRHRRKAPPSPPGRYVLETSLLIAALSGLLWRHGVPLAALGLQPVSTLRFAMDLAICLTPIIGLDVLSVHLAIRQMRNTSAPSIATSETSGVVGDALAGRQNLASFIPVAVVGAVWEELCFRGIIFMFSPRTLAWLAAGTVSSSLLFGLQHLRNGAAGVAYSSFYGLLFACLYLATGDLVAVMVTHAAGNIFATVYGAPRIARIRRQQALRTAVFLG